MDNDDLLLETCVAGLLPAVLEILWGAIGTILLTLAGGQLGIFARDQLYMAVACPGFSRHG